MRRRSKRFLSLILILVAILAALPAHAQDGDTNPHPLIQMLSRTPAQFADLAQSDDYLWNLSYVDRIANEQARPGVPSPATWAENMALDDPSSKLWIANIQRLMSMPLDIYYWLLSDEEMVNYLGLDIFEIDRVLAFGPRPLEGVIYGGHFDIDRIKDTLTRRTYTVTELSGIPVLCGPVGCENGDAMNQWLPDVSSIDPETHDHPGTYGLFGGRWGQQQPLGLLPGMILSTADWETLGMMAAAGSGDSLYDVPDYRAVADLAVEAESSNRTLIQVVYFAPSYFEYRLYMYLLQQMLPDEADALLGRLGMDTLGRPLGAEDLPPYSLGAIVDWQEGPDQMHGIALVYDNEADARRAAAEVTRRIPQQSAYPDWLVEMALIDRAVSEYTLEPPQAVYNADVDRWLAVAIVRTPMPGNDPDPENENQIPRSGVLLNYWFMSLQKGLFVPAQLTPVDE